MSRRWLTLTLCALVLPGCFGAEDAVPAAEEGAAPGVTVDEARPEPAFTDIPNARLGQVAAPDAAATLAEPPILQTGEWWRIELHDQITDTTTQFIRVVARVEPDLYVFGMPHEGWWKEAVIFHSPAFGDVNKDLSHRAHDVPFQPLKFPLEDGATWETAWENPTPVTATVTVESPTVARITYTSEQCGIWTFFSLCPSPADGVIGEMVYDASVHEVVEASWPSHTWRVIDHGYGFQGWVTVPRAEHLVFFHGRMGTPFYDPFNARPGAPLETIPIEGGYNRVSFILGAGNILGAGAGGAYSEKATAPDGTVYELASIPGGPFQVSFLEHADPDGDWTLEHVAAGPGFVFIEGIAYHQYDISVPDGAVRTDHSHEVVR